MDGPPDIEAWQIVGALGRGGMGTVWRAVHRRTGVVAALKTIERAEPSFAASIRREITALATLRHPGVVRVLDQGVHRGLPWYAMELVPGRDLRAHLTEATSASATFASASGASFGTWADEPGGGSVVGGGDRPWTARPLAFAWLGRLARTLAWLHGEGLVHRDLKPDNVVIRPDGRVVLVDFGVASRFAGAGGRESLELGLAGGGTAAYVAPEQIRGEAADARADLYALGCVLVEVLTGRPPFEGAAADLMRAHLHLAPAPPSSRVDGVPPVLDALALALLEKDPARRLAYADDVAAALAPWDLEPTDLPTPRPYLYRPSLAGRAEALTAVELALGEGARVLLVGEAGVGKTRLALEVARRRGPGVQLWTSTCAPETAPSPFASMAPVLATLALRLRGDLPAARRALGASIPWLAGLLGATELASEPDPAAGVPPALARRRVIEAVDEALRWLAGPGGALWVVDDAQWVDASTAEVLGRVGGAVRVVGTARGEEPGGAAERIGWHRVAVERLTDDATVGVIGDMLAVSPVPPSVREAVAAEAAGNPFFVGELLRGAVEEGTLVRRAGRWWPDEARFRAVITDGLRAGLGRRLGGLPPEAEALARAGAALGRDVDLEVAQRAAGLDDDEAVIAERELRRRYVLDDAPEPRFAHERLRDALLDGLSPFDHEALHRSAAHALGALRPGRVAERAAHHEAGGERAEARAAYREAARRAYAAYADDEGVRLASASLRLVDGPELEAIETRTAMGRALARLARPEALPALEQAVAEARALGEPGLLARTVATWAELLYDRGDARAAEAAYRECEALADLSGEPRAIVAARLGLAAVRMDAGRTEEAAVAVADALAAARAQGVLDMEGRAWSMAGSLAHLKGRTQDALDAFARALERMEEAGDRWRAAVLRANRGAVASGVGRRAEARADLLGAIAVYRELGIDRTLGSALYNLGTLETQEGRFDEARTALDDALAVFRKHGLSAWEACGVRELGRVDWLVGRRDEAWARLRAAEATLAGLDAADDMLSTLLLAARWRRLEGRLVEASATVDEALALAERTGLARGRIGALAERVHLAVARGGDGRAELEALLAAPHDPDLAEVREAVAAMEGAGR